MPFTKRKPPGGNGRPSERVLAGGFDFFRDTPQNRKNQPQHSRKPAEFYELVESLCVGRMLDYFSREPRPGWEQFGNDPAKFGGAA